MHGIAVAISVLVPGVRQSGNQLTFPSAAVACLHLSARAVLRRTCAAAIRCRTQLEVVTSLPS